MSLQRYVNRDIILKLRDVQYGQTFSNKDLEILPELYLIPNDPNLVTDQVVEVHIYSFYGDYITGNHSAGYVNYEKTTQSLLMDIASVFSEAGIKRGSFIVAVNLFKKIWGGFNDGRVLVQEISPDRTELKFRVESKYSNEYNSFVQYIQSLRDNDILNYLVINFGYNRIEKVVNFWVDQTEPGVFYIKLYNPLVDEIDNRDIGWFGLEVVDSYIDSVILTAPVDLGKTTALKGPNFNLDASLYSIETTAYKSWEDVLDADLPTSQRIIDSTLSGSGIQLNIDYTDFANFIFYSSAKERLENFYYKVQKVEEYKDDIKISLASTASNTFFLSSSIAKTQKRIDGIQSGYDDFEKWMWYETTSSIFTHDLSGSNTPYPKYFSGSRWIQHHSTSSIVKNWYNNFIERAEIYDQTNFNRLYWAIPEHIIMDEGNSDFVLFVDMVGQHYDTIYSYVKALTDIHVRDESPKRGFSNELSYYIAKSYGWQLQNTRQLSDIWKYKLGQNQLGQYEQTGSLFALSHENQTQQIWRRIVNNLPYLLKTKGTSRSIKALTAIYGIPQTLISIKEYGGPSIEGNRPNLIEDRFAYALRFSGSQYIKMDRRPYQGTWSTSRTPDTVEFRFKTAYSASVSMSLWSIIDSGSNTKSALDIVHHGSKYSGSYAYGYLRFTQTVQSASNDVSYVVSGSKLPLFDNDYWTVRLYSTASLDYSGSIFIDVQRAHDSLYGRVSHTGSIEFSTKFNLNKYWNSGSRYVVLGGNTGSNSTRFIGWMQGYKEYYTKYSANTFESHVLNPAAYFDDTTTGSFDTLVRYYPLGIDAQRWDHSVYLQVSSSHPNQKQSLYTTSSFVGFGLLGTEKEQYDIARETHYVTQPTLGGYSINSEKIRFEDDKLIRSLNPSIRSSIGNNDRSTFDSNKLAIVFSPTDQVNNEVYNHTGYFELDEYIGDPEYEFEQEYSELNRFSRQYFKKYQKDVNVNEFVNLFSIYDFSFFDQIKQLVPARANLVAGVLIEDDVLHRSKSVLSKRPRVSNPQYETTYNLGFGTASALMLAHETSASQQPNFDIRYQYLTGSVYDTFTFDIVSTHHLAKANQNTGLFGSTLVIQDPYSGSSVPTQSIYQNTPKDCCYQKVIFHYSASGNFATPYLKKWYTAVSMSNKMYYSKSLECASYQIDECSNRNHGRFYGSYLSGPGINIDSTETIDGGPVVSIFYTNEQNIYYNSGLKGNLQT